MTDCRPTPKPWTDKELARLKKGGTAKELAEALGRTEDMVRNKLKSLGLRADPMPLGNAGFVWTPAMVARLKRGGTVEAMATDLHVSESSVRSQLKRRKLPYVKQEPVRDESVQAPVTPLEKQGIAHYKKKVEELEADKERDALFLKALDRASEKGYRPLSKPVISLYKGPGTPISFLAPLSDWHAGKHVSPDETLGQGNYSPAIMLDRIWDLQERTLAIMEATKDPIDEYVACLGGDMVDGMLKHGAEIDQVHTIMDQTMLCAHTVAQYLRNIASVVPKVRVYSTPGNHARHGHQKKTPTSGQYSSWDMVVAQLAKGLTRDVPNIHWDLNKQIFQRFKVQGHGVLLLHGHTLKGGSQSQLSVPAHALSRLVSSVAQTAARLGTPADKFIVHGHFHKEWCLPSGLGRIIGSPSPVGMDDFAIAQGFQHCDPAQTLIAVHPRMDMIGYYPINLSAAKPGCGNGFAMDELLG